MDKYEYWQIKVVHDCNNSLWNTVAEESNTAVKADDGNVFLSINKAPYVSGKYFPENTVQTVKFVPKTASEGSKVNLIFAANSALEFDNNTKELKKIAKEFRHFSKYATQISQEDMKNISITMFTILKKQKQMLQLIENKLDIDIWQEINKKDHIESQ